MTKVLVLNHPQYECGVQQFGKRVFELCSNSTNIEYIYRELTTYDEYGKILGYFKPEHILYNWHQATMSWLKEEIVKSLTEYKHYFIFHDGIRYNYDKFLFFGDYDIDNKLFPKDKTVLLPRPLLNYNGEYPTNNTIIIGSFGFAFWQKGLDKLVEVVNRTFDKAIINIHASHSHFGDHGDTQSKAVIKKCMELNTNPNVTLNITRDFKSDTDVLKFLAGNDINVFMYTENGNGISSAVDYALSVKRPIAVTRCNMFRHILKDKIVLSETNTIQNILSRGTEPLNEFYTRWSTQNFIKEMDEIFK